MCNGAIDTHVCLTIRVSTDNAELILTMRGYMFFSVRESFHLNPYPVKLISLTFQKLELCLATATYNFKWLKIT